MTIEKAKELRKKMELATAWMNDTDALECINFFPNWKTQKKYIIGERIKYNNLLYKCIKEHDSIQGWEPDQANFLWQQITEKEWPEWVQPTGSADAYNAGEKITYNNQHYISLINENTKNPEEYEAGWEKQG